MHLTKAHRVEEQATHEQQLDEYKNKVALLIYRLAKEKSTSTTWRDMHESE